MSAEIAERPVLDLIFALIRERKSQEAVNYGRCWLRVHQ